MKFALALAFVLATSFVAYCQSPQPEPAKPQSDLLAFLDSLRLDPSFQQEMNQLAEGLFTAIGASPHSILHQPLPDFSLSDLEGQILTNEDLFGKVVLLHIWHPDYETAPELHTQLDQLQDFYQDQDVLFLSLTTVQPEYLTPYLQRFPLHFRHFPAAYSLICQISMIPQNILVDRNGIIRYTTASFSDLMFGKDTLDLPALREQIDDLLVE
ncbi:TlpA family protein disulfide reductase [Flavilitoribacter nigricans]|uniref:Thioredoxin domain-containing protein n=1 Tax=Flavilitoribacter nigricans (strain ATCC 23147 / DSM 23189 / NBRC 102662 / NCIMB 1420 / SS-2) TaxID=1122177 RepID=A0A2D0NJ54_FLAN2|nr:TlpA disulfide reductase family protein [Flavilitoribacter nigricans]PHN07783.1 hypothetical protein CRP01_04490 [Flavilitoribacter nigricans DSM 23189 = NBRC 102662]